MSDDIVQIPVEIRDGDHRIAADLHLSVEHTPRDSDGRLGTTIVHSVFLRVTPALLLLIGAICRESVFALTLIIDDEPAFVIIELDQMRISDGLLELDDDPDTSLIQSVIHYFARGYYLEKQTT